MSINENINRLGRFTSSRIGDLMTNGKAKDSLGKPALTYIKEKQWERKLGRSINIETNSKPTEWGHICELIAFSKLGSEYYIVSKETLPHPEYYNIWAGSPDVQKYDDGLTIGDIKSPFTLKSFCQLVEPIYQGLTGIDAMNYIRDNHQEGDNYYYQLVSNACITGAKYAEFIVYCPYQSEIQRIKDEQIGGWLMYASKSELPWIPNDGYYKDINIIRFEVPVEDKKLLTKRVIEAGKFLQ